MSRKYRALGCQLLRTGVCAHDRAWLIQIPVGSRANRQLGLPNTVIPRLLTIRSKSPFPLQGWPTKDQWLLRITARGLQCPCIDNTFLETLFGTSITPCRRDQPNGELSRCRHSGDAGCAALESSASCGDSSHILRICGVSRRRRIV